MEPGRPLCRDAGGQVERQIRVGRAGKWIRNNGGSFSERVREVVAWVAGVAFDPRGKHRAACTQEVTQWWDDVAQRAGTGADLPDSESGAAVRYEKNPAFVW